ncbi:MAG: UDP-3-O-(3-hydroxymyristoyl)glucosamine N-acyltransferase [Candidatus Omnitrophica bacterium]|nr:UDP-3-O-(3-hydroxymyristoyl)glucosamine N-acyltransferase [Candidatus Omnitrophota bacterium]
MKKTLSELARIVGGRVDGDPNTVITGVSGIKEASEGDITFLANPKYVPLADTTQASAIIVSEDLEPIPNHSLIRAENPSLAFARIVTLLAPNETVTPKGIHSTAVLGQHVKLGKNVAMQPYVVVDDYAEIADDVILYAGVYVGHHTKIGKATVIYPNVSIREYVEIGARVIIHSGSVIGSDGFGFATVKGVHHKIPQIGNVVLSDDVEIGSNVTIDRARFGTTFIGRGTKIDNLVQIAHNVTIGEHSIIVAQCGISGSTTVGNGVVMAGQAGIVGHITIGDNVTIAAQSGVTKSVPDNACVLGQPAKPFNRAKRIFACMAKLPEMFKSFSTLEDKVARLERKLGGVSADNKKAG